MDNVFVYSNEGGGIIDKATVVAVDLQTKENKRTTPVASWKA